MIVTTKKQVKLAKKSAKILFKKVILTAERSRKMAEKTERSTKKLNIDVKG